MTRAVYQAIVPTGYGGSKNENWYIRLLPPPIPGSTEHVVSTTPYVVVSPTSRIGWRIFSRRCLPRRASNSYERHMKYRPTREYWNDYVFEAYVNYQMDAIYLAGLPTFPTAALIPRSLTGMAGRPGLHKAALAGGQTGWTT